MNPHPIAMYHKAVEELKSVQLLATILEVVKNVDAVSVAVVEKFKYFIGTPPVAKITETCNVQWLYHRCAL